MLKNLIGRLRKPLAVVGLVAGLAMGTAPAANADTFSFSYSGSGVSFSAIITAILDPAGTGYWIPTGVVSGTRNLVAVTGLAPCHACLPASDVGAGYPSDAYFSIPSAGGSAADQLEFILADSSVYTFNYLGPNYAGYGGSGGTEWAGSPQPGTNFPAGGNIGYPYTAYCVPNGGNCLATGDPDIHAVQVPEINASAGVGALGVLLGFMLLLREMFVRRRNVNNMSVA